MRTSFSAVLLSISLLACDTGSGLSVASLAPGPTVEPAAPGPVEAISAVSQHQVPDAALADLADLQAAPATDPGSPTAGTSDGDGLIVDEQALSGRFVYGIGADPGSIIANVGNTVAGIIALPAVIDIDEQAGVVVIRVVDSETDRPVPGDDGVIESYAFTRLEDGRLRIDFTAPRKEVEIRLFGSCRYELQSYALVGAAVYADGLLTWPADESYQRRNCGGAVPRNSEGVNVHFLRHESASAGFAKRASDPESPFGFFLAQGTEGEAPPLARLKGIGGGAADGTITYYLSANFPEAHEAAARRAFDAWNDTLEETAGNRPFVLQRATEDIIPWDPRHHVVYWDDTQGSGAVAPFVEDPGNGEIFVAYVIMWLGDMDRLIESYDEFFTDNPRFGEFVLPPEAGEALPQPAWERPVDLPPNLLQLRPFPRRPLNLDVVRRIAELSRDLSDAELADVIVTDFLLHELGHNLGLRHNFKASADFTHTEAEQTASSTMDYVAGVVRPGPYDADAMRYGYGEGALTNDYLYCSDEHVEADPGCAQWDFGHPVQHFVDVLDAIIAETPLTLSGNGVEAEARDKEYASLFRRLRQFLNTDYEVWDGANPAVSVFDTLLDKVVCTDECEVHLWFRQQLALYLLYTRHVLTAYWEPQPYEDWFDFPALDGTQAALLMDSFFELVTDPDQPRALKTTIIEKLPTANVPGAGDLLHQLRGHFAALDAPSPDELALLDAVDAALD